MKVEEVLSSFKQYFRKNTVRFRENQEVTASIGRLLIDFNKERMLIIDDNSLSSIKYEDIESIAFYAGDGWDYPNDIKIIIDKDNYIKIHV
jgi:hypothetical protein